MLVKNSTVVIDLMKVCRKLMQEEIFIVQEQCGVIKRRDVLAGRPTVMNELTEIA